MYDKFPISKSNCETLNSHPLFVLTISNVKLSCVVCFDSTIALPFANTMFSENTNWLLISWVLKQFVDIEKYSPLEVKLMLLLESETMKVLLPNEPGYSGKS